MHSQLELVQALLSLQRTVSVQLFWKSGPQDIPIADCRGFFCDENLRTGSSEYKDAQYQ